MRLSAVGLGCRGGLTEALRTGQPQNEMKGGGEPFFAALYAEPRRLRGFPRSSRSSRTTYGRTGSRSG